MTRLRAIGFDQPDISEKINTVMEPRKPPHPTPFFTMAKPGVSERSKTPVAQDVGTSSSQRVHLRTSR